MAKVAYLIVKVWKKCQFELFLVYFVGTIQVLVLSRIPLMLNATARCFLCDKNNLFGG